MGNWTSSSLLDFLVDWISSYLEWAKEPLPETIDYQLWFWFLFANGLQLLQLFYGWEMPKETGKQWRERCLKFDKQDSWWRV